ncbi:MAG TPA: 4-hydroxyphenylpyruvate dioxygenase [Leptolyngbyaceae cyanobacterium]
MKIDRVHFYVEDARKYRNWFVDRFGFQALGGDSNYHTRRETVKSGPVYFVLSSPLSSASPVADYLDLHPPGVVDITFRVPNIESLVDRATSEGVKFLQPLQKTRTGNSDFKWCQIAAWGGLRHTLIEEEPGKGKNEENSSAMENPSDAPISYLGIDHIVLNVNAGEMEKAVTWYEKVLGFQRQQKFSIQTERSGLHSQVMYHPSGWVKLPINEPASGNSQIQEFLDVNKGPGIQHIALQALDLVSTVKQLRAAGLPFIQVPPSYYSQLEQRQPFPLSAKELKEVAKQQILVDWETDINQLPTEFSPLLLQTFTNPIFSQPTFFFELIERRVCCINGRQQQAEGFGEGNFRALFEAIELEQMKRGSLGLNKS